jgi:hypothetical protein
MTRRGPLLLGLVALAAITTIACPSASLGATGPNGETLTLTPECSTYPPWHGVTLTLAGFPPRSVVQGEITFPGGGGAGYGPVSTDDNGGYSAFTSTSSPGTFYGYLRWSGGTLTESLYIDCASGRGSPEAEPLINDFSVEGLGIFSAPKSVAVYNHGRDPLTVRETRLGGSNPHDFLIAADSCTGAILEVGGNCFVRVRFGPQEVGPRSAVIELITSAGSEPYPITLQGQGSPGSSPEGSRLISAFVEPNHVAAGHRTCFLFHARDRAANPLARALVRFAGEKVRTNHRGAVTVCKSFTYRGTRTARIRKQGYRSVLLRIQVTSD